MVKKFIHIILFFHYSLFTIHLYAQQTEKLYLSGTGNDNTVNWEFFCTGGMNAGKWTTIPVPSCWELQGFGKYDYGFAKDSVRGKEKGLYKYSFNASSTWKNKIVKIVFEGVMTDAEVKVNGQSAGEIHQGAFYAFKYDISGLLKYGQTNLLEVTVAKHSSNQSVNEAERKADFWIFGGIFRPVWLEIVPETHIENIFFDAKADGSLLANIEIWHTITHDFIGYNIQTRIIEIKTNKLITQFDTKGPRMMDIKKKVMGVKPWTPESPSLYKVIFTLSIGGKVYHAVEKRVGFRTVEVKQRDGIYVNGVKVKMKGVNRHSFRPETGRTMSKQNSIEDVLLMKDMNMNAVRMSHYPPDDHFLDVCDSLGLFVIDELAGWHGNYDAKTGTKLLKEMIDHDVNHPSIIMWANGNEGGHNLDLDTLFKQYDIQERPVIHPWQLFGGIETQHYREYNYGIGNYENGREIVMPTEFLHGQFDGGHGAGLEDYWEKMWHDPLSAGGFLWDFADNAVVRKDLHDSLDTDKYHAADGIVGPHHEKEGSYYAIKEIWSPVHFEEKQITPQFNGVFNIENRFHFTNTRTCNYAYELIDWRGEEDPLKGNILAPDMKPGAKGELKVLLPADWKKYDVLKITVKYQNSILLIKTFALHSPGENPWIARYKKTGTAPQLSETDSLFIVKVAGAEFDFHKRSGFLMKVKNEHGEIPFGNGPIIQEGTNNFSGFTARRDHDTLVIASVFDRKEHYNTLEWKIYPGGFIKMKVRYFPAAYFTSMAGVNFSYPEDPSILVNYTGDGPYRVWKNRLKGNQFGVWTKHYNNTETGEWPWKYPEFKGYYSNMHQVSMGGHGNIFWVGTTTESLFLRLFTPAWKTDQWHNYEPVFPSGDISFMQGIPSIGTKTQRNETTGPMGLKNIFYDYEKDPSRALQIELYFDFTVDK